MHVTRATDSDEWNAFVRSQGGPVFATREWGELCRLYGHDVHYLAARDGDALVGVLPLVHMSSRLFGSKLVSMPFSEYGSAVVADDAPTGTVDELLDRTAELADELGVDFVSLRGRDFGDRPPFVGKRRFVTFDVSLEGGSDAVWDALDSSRRTHVRRARDNGVEVAEATDLADVREYYRLYLLSMRGHGSPPHSFAFFRRLWELFGGSGPLTLTLATVDGRPINGGVRFRFAGTAYGWGAVSDYEYRDLDGGSLLHWTEIKRSCERGASTFTLGRTREGTGVYTFKKSLGGEKRWLDDYHYFPGGETELPNPDGAKFDAVKRVWRKLPVGLTRTVGPTIRRGISL